MKVPRLTIGAFRGERGRDLAVPRRPRRSRRQIAVRATVAAAVLLLLGGGGYWMMTSPTFQVSRVESGRFRYSSRPAVDAALSRCLGRTIWTLGRGDVAAACADLPWVREVHVRWRLPDTVVVELVEWNPLLGVVDATRPDDALLVLGDGRIVSAPAHLEAPGLPLLVGIRTDTDDAGQPRLADGDLAPLLDLVQALRDTGLETACPVDFVRRTEAGFVLELQGRAGSLLLGHEDFPRRLTRYLLARERIPAGAAVDLRFEDRVTFEPPSPDRT